MVLFEHPNPQKSDTQTLQFGHPNPLKFDTQTLKNQTPKPSKNHLAKKIVKVIYEIDNFGHINE